MMHAEVRDDPKIIFSLCELTGSQPGNHLVVYKEAFYREKVDTVCLSSGLE